MSLAYCRKTIFAAIAAIALTGCVDSVAETDEVFYRWNGKRSLCGVSIDEKLDVSLADIRGGMERARDRGEVLILYAHAIGSSVSMTKLEEVLTTAADLGLPFLTFPELADPPPTNRAGVALTFDDAHIDSWHAAIDLFARYEARATFFVSRFHFLSDTAVDQVRDLYSSGHAIESHGKNHLDATIYAEEYGVSSYVEDEVLSSLEALRAEGFTPTTFAYPFGARTGETDHAILRHVSLVRSISWLFASNGLLNDPCGE